MAFSITLVYNERMKRPWLCIAVAIVLGEVGAFSFGVSWWIAAVVIAIAAALAVFVLNIGMDKKRILIVMGAAFLFGMLRLGLDDYTYRHVNELNALGEGSVKKEYAAKITDIDVKPERLVIHCDELLVYYEPAEGEKFQIGNTIGITGSFSCMDRPSNPGEFNYYLYYRANHITHRCFADKVRIISAEADEAAQLLFDVRMNLLNRISALYNDEDAGILRAALLGDKSLLDQDLYDLYKKNGIAHLLAISGLHVGILGMSLYRLLRKRLHLSFMAAGIICGLWLCVYSALTGSGVSTLRAVIMLILIFIAGMLGMHYDMLNSAGIAAAAILIARPYELFNCGFLLSFACVIAIAGPARYIIKTLDVKNPVVSSFVLSMTIQIFTLPVTSYFFFEVSLYGCLLNLVVIPLMTYVVWSGIAAILLSFAAVPLAALAAKSGHVILYFYSRLGSFALKLPCSSILIGRPKLWQIIVYYCFFFAVLYLSPSSLRRLKSLFSTWGRETESI